MKNQRKNISLYRIYYMEGKSILEVLLLGIGLAMDCFAVSLSKGISAKRLFGGAFLMAAFFGMFHSGMPLIGYFAGAHFADFIGRTAPWVALVLLGFIGGKMIREHFSEGENVGTDADYGIRTLVLLSVATSIDTLATGLLFVGKENAIWLAVAVIGCCSVAFSVCGTLLGVFAGSRFKFPAKIIGGLILIGIGLKIWIEGLFL